MPGALCLIGIPWLHFQERVLGERNITSLLILVVFTPSHMFETTIFNFPSWTMENFWNHQSAYVRGFSIGMFEWWRASYKVRGSWTPFAQKCGCALTDGPKPRWFYVDISHVYHLKIGQWQWVAPKNHWTTKWSMSRLAITPLSISINPIKVHL
jgi:hypothetical protein